MDTVSPLQTHREIARRRKETESMADVDQRLARLREVAAEWTANLPRLLAVAETSGPEEWHALADSYASGLGTPRDRAAAKAWYQRAAGAGHTPSMIRLGYIFLHQETPPNPAPGLAWLRHGAELGNGWGMASLGFAYRDGHGTECDPARALKWFLRAVEAGHTSSMMQVGKLYAGELRSPVEAGQWFHRAAEAGNPEAPLYLAMLYDDRDSAVYDPTEAVKWYRTVVDSGRDRSGRWMLALARHYRDGVGVPRDPVLARDWLQRLLAVVPETGAFYKEAAQLHQEMQDDLL